MHLQDGESGGTAYGVSTGAESYGYSHTIDPSSSRTIHFQSGVPSNQSVAEFLLAWTLVLYRDNDDSLGNVSWGHLGHATTPKSVNSFDVKAVPFEKSDTLEAALGCVRERSASDESTITPHQPLFFNNGVEAGQGETHKQSSRRSHNVSVAIPTDSYPSANPYQVVISSGSHSSRQPSARHSRAMGPGYLLVPNSVHSPRLIH